MDNGCVAYVKDAEIRKSFQRTLQKQGMKFKLSTKVTGADMAGDKVKLTVEKAAGGSPEEIETDIVLVSTGGSVSRQARNSSQHGMV